MSKGKAYANRNEVVDNDLYHTPECLTLKLLEKEKFKKVLEPACGDMAIVDPLRQNGVDVIFSDIERGADFLTAKLDLKKSDIITNPPFFLWDEFIKKSKELNSRKSAFIGRANYFGTVDRYNSGIFDGLKTVYFFNRYVDYRTPRRKDGLFHVGAMLTGWFVWERGYKGKPQIDYIDVQDYAKLGMYREKDYKILDFLGISSTWTPHMDLDFYFAIKQIENEFKIKLPVKDYDRIDSISKLLKSCKNIISS
jgi:hypothetical protein